MIKQVFYLYPCSEEYPLSQLFGENPDGYKRFGLNGHNGMDIALPTGQDVCAAGDGQVTLAEARSDGYGRHVRIRHANGDLTLYAHLSQLMVKPGQTAAAGEPIGRSGGDPSDPWAGNSSGPHLHFELRPAAGGTPGYGGAVNPLPLLCSHDYQPEQPALYQTEVLAEQLNIRTRPDLKARIAESAGRGRQFSVLQEMECGGLLWLRLHTPLSRYLCARQDGQNYTRRLMPCSSRPTEMPWDEAITQFLRGLGYTGPEPQPEPGRRHS